MDSFREVARSLRASPVFAFYVLATLGLAALFGVMIGVMQIQPGFLGMGHFTDPSHRTHELTYSLLVGVAIVGLLAQLRRPSKNVAAMLMALVPTVGLLLAAVLSGDLGVILSTERLLVAVGTVMAALLHPTGRELFRSISIARINRVTLALVVVAAVPLLAFATTNIGLQGSAADDHARAGHYGFMAAFGFTVIGVGLLASLRPDGWWLPAWVAGLLPISLGLISLMLPGNSSSLDPVWALAAIAWGVVFIAAAEFTQVAQHPTPLGARRLRSEDVASVQAQSAPTTRTSRPANVLGVIAVVPIVLFFVVPILAGGPAGGHGPGQAGPGQSPAMDSMGNTAPIDGAHELAVTANKQAFELEKRIELTVGQPVNVALSSVDTLHDLTVDEIEFHIAADAGETVVGGLVFDEPGTYVAYCSVPGHREAGMEFEIVVTAA
jgi:heme/copper-type cytochrome/quinol oxidase subunit 2